MTTVPTPPIPLGSTWEVTSVSSSRHRIDRGWRNFGLIYGSRKEAQAIVDLRDMAYWIAFGDDRQAYGETVKNLKARAKKIMKALGEITP